MAFACPFGKGPPWSSRLQDSFPPKNIVCPVPTNSVLYVGTVPTNSVLYVGTVPTNSVLYVGTVPTNSVLYVGTVPTNSHFDLKKKIEEFTALEDFIDH